MKYLAPLFLALLLVSCDYVDDPLGDEDGPVIIVDGEPRRVLLEDLTGHACNNCPQAAEIAEELSTIYGDLLVVVGVHMTQEFASPKAPLDDDSLDTDFRTPAGDAYENTFNILSLPKGLVSRKPFNNSIPLSRSSWSSAVADIIGQEADLKLWFDSLDYNTTTHTLYTTVKALCIHPISGDHNLTIYLTEDHVIDGQIDAQQSPPYVPNYDHRHVLRDNVNGTWGASLITGSASVGDTLELSYSYTLPGNVVNPANCSLVAYVHSTGGTDEYEVKQVVERKIQP